MNAEAARAICAIGQRLSDAGLTPGNSGNISVRTADGYLATPANAALGRLVPERLAVLDRDGTHRGGDAPTKEVPLHRALYECRGDATAIVHVHSTYAVALACVRDVDPDDVLEPLTPYALLRVGRLVLAPYARPGSVALAASVAAVAAASAAILLANHGPIVAATSLESAFAAIVEIEAAAKLQLVLRGCDVRRLSAADVAELRPAPEAGEGRTR